MLWTFEPTAFLYVFTFLSAGDQVEDLLGEGDHDTACHRQHTVGALRGIMALERQAHL